MTNRGITKYLYEELRDEGLERLHQAMGAVYAHYRPRFNRIAEGVIDKFPATMEVPIVIKYRGPSGSVGHSWRSPNKFSESGGYAEVQMEESDAFKSLKDTVNEAIRKAQKETYQEMRALLLELQMSFDNWKLNMFQVAGATDIVMPDFESTLKKLE